MPHDDISITVKYTGKENFNERTNGDPPFHQIKLEAMKHFGIEAAAAANYVLQYDGVDLPDDQHVRALNQSTLVLILTLKHEPPKG